MSIIILNEQNLSEPDVGDIFVSSFLIPSFLFCVWFLHLLLESVSTVYIIQWSSLAHEHASFHSQPFCSVNDVQVLQRPSCSAPSHYTFAVICVIWCFSDELARLCQGSLALDEAIGAHKCPITSTVFIVKVNNMVLPSSWFCFFYLSPARKSRGMVPFVKANI